MFEKIAALQELLSQQSELLEERHFKAFSVLEAKYRASVGQT